MSDTGHNTLLWREKHRNYWVTDTSLWEESGEAQQACLYKFQQVFFQEN